MVGAHAVLKRARPDAMIERLALDWDARRLATLRFDAQRLVAAERPRIRVVAAALVQHRRLTADQIARIGLT